MRKRQPESRSLHRFLARYIKLLVLAFAGYLVFFFGISTVMEYQVLRKRQETSALNAKVYMDTILTHITQTSYLIRSNEAVNKLMYAPMTAAIDDYVQAYREINRQVTQIDLLDSCYVYLIPVQTVLASSYGKAPIDKFYDRELLGTLMQLPGVSYLAHVPKGISAPAGADYLVQAIRYATTIRNNAGMVCMNLSRPRLEQKLRTFVAPGWQIRMLTGDTVLLGGRDDSPAPSRYFLSSVDLNHSGLRLAVAIDKWDFCKDMAARFLRDSLLFVAFALIVGFLLSVLLSSFNNTFRSLVMQLAGYYSRQASDLGLQDLNFYFGRLVDDNRTYAARLDETAHVVRDKLLTDLLMGRIVDEDEHDKLSEYMDIRFPHGRFMAACIDLDGRDTAAEPGEILRAKAVIKETLERRHDLIAFVVPECDDVVGVVINFEGSPEALQTKLGQIIESLRCGFGDEINLFASFSKPVALDELADAFSKARLNLNRKYFLEEACVQFDDTPDLPQDSLLAPRLAQMVRAAVATQSFGAVYQQTRAIASLVQQGDEQAFHRYRATLIVLCGVALDHVGAGSKPGRLRQHAASMAALAQAESIDGVSAAFAAFLSSLADDVAQRSKPYSVNQYVVNAVDFISGAYDQDLSVGRIAGQLNLNVKYFSRLFKEHTGMTVMQFLSDIRMQRAAELLKETSLPVREIGERVGIPDSRSFIRHFKRHFGTTPGAFRSR